MASSISFSLLQRGPSLPPLLHPYHHLLVSSLQRGTWSAAWCFGGGNVSNLSLDFKQTQIAWMSCETPEQIIPGRQSFWSYFRSKRFTYSSNLADVDTTQLSELWAKTLKVIRDPQDITKALKHSYAFVVVYEQVEEIESPVGSHKKLVGFGRAVSDGVFIATICDVAVDPDYQKRGIGGRIVKELVKNMKRKGGPTGFAVFPPPRARSFFWSIGFRSDRQFRFMIYRGGLAEEATPNDESISKEVRIE